MPEASWRNHARIVIAGYGVPALNGVQVLFAEGIGPDRISLLTYGADTRNAALLAFAEGHRIAVSMLPVRNEEAGRWMKAQSPDLLLSLHYRDRIPEQLLEIPTRGAVNLHPSLLPDYRGCLSVPWAIINAETHTGFTYHRMVGAFDAGAILAQEALPIRPEDTAFSLFHRQITHGLAALPQVLRLVLEEGETGRAQPPGGRYYGRTLPFDGRIDRSWPPERIECFIRAMVFPPFKGAVVEIDGRDIEVLSWSHYLELVGGPARH